MRILLSTVGPVMVSPSKILESIRSAVADLARSMAKPAIPDNTIHTTVKIKTIFKV